MSVPAPPLRGAALMVTALALAFGTFMQVLAGAGFAVRTPNGAHLCCGSAGTYNILQPELAGRLGDRKVANIERLGADVIATGNVGCAMQIGQRTATPLVHTVELVDWATGGPAPRALRHLAEKATT